MSEEDKQYEESVRKIRSAVKSMSFEQATRLLDVKDEALRLSIIDDALKVLIAEMHFAGGNPLKDVAKALGLPLGRLERAKAEMLKDVEAAAIEAYKESLKEKGPAGNA